MLIRMEASETSLVTLYLQNIFTFLKTLVFLLDQLVLKRIEKVRVNNSVKIYFNEKLNAGEGRLKIEFDGILNESLNGFYRIKCPYRDGSVGNAAVTQFEVCSINKLVIQYKRA